MKIREQWNNFKKNVKDLKKEDIRTFLPKVDLKIDLSNLKGNFLLLFQEKLDHNVILHTLEHMAFTGQVTPHEVMRYSESKILTADQYAKIRNYRKNSYHLLDPSVVPINTLTELPKLKFMITDKAEFSHREASKRAAALQRLYGNRERKYGFRHLNSDVYVLNETLRRIRNSGVAASSKDRDMFYSRLLDVIERVESFGYYLECNGNELKLYESKPAAYASESQV